MKFKCFLILSLLLLGLAPAPRQDDKTLDEKAPESFRPTENLPADSGVSFPVDI